MEKIKLQVNRRKEIKIKGKSINYETKAIEKKSMKLKADCLRRSIKFIKLQPDWSGKRRHKLPTSGGKRSDINIDYTDIEE